MKALVIKEAEVEFAKALGCEVYRDNFNKIIAVAESFDPTIFAAERSFELRKIPSDFSEYIPNKLKKIRNRIEEYLRKNATIYDFVRVAKMFGIPTELRIAGYMSQSKQFGDIDNSTQVTSINILDVDTGEEELDQHFSGNIWEYQFQEFDYYVDDEEYNKIAELK